MKILASLVVLLGVVSTAHAVTVPPCVVDGYQVPVLQGYSNEPSPAYSGVEYGRPVIFFNNKFLDEIPDTRSFLSFVELHECGHIVLGHVYTKSRTAAEQKEKELQADCYAAEQVRKLNDEQEGRFLSINAVIKNVQTWPSDPEHPDGQTRAATIAQCYNNPNTL